MYWASLKHKNTLAYMSKKLVNIGLLLTLEITKLKKKLNLPNRDF